jgi:acyl carrier protein
MNNMTIENIEERLIKEISIILSIDPSMIIPDTPLHSLGLDSLRFVELLVFIEKKFNLNLMESGLTREDFQTIRSLATCINKMR